MGSSVTSTREEYEFIVIGSGAGGGPVAANLAREGKRVLLLEAGGRGNNPRSKFKYEVPGADPRTDFELGWVYWINSRARLADGQKQHFYVTDKGGLYYPRGTSIGGSTCANAMIVLYPDNSDWDGIAQLTGDDSWDAVNMRRYFERLERVRYQEPTPGNPERHGYKGWLPVEQVGTKDNLFKNKWLTQYLVPRIRGERNGELFAQAAATGSDFHLDPNAWSFVEAHGEGLADPPREAEDGLRRGTRELLLATEKSHPKNLTIRTDCLATRLIFHEKDRTRVIGVEYLQGPHLYRASLLAEWLSPKGDVQDSATPTDSRPGVRREVFAAKEVIVSGGAFNSPQLLMLSGIGPKEQLERHHILIRVERPGVGRNLQDRLETGVVCRLPYNPSPYVGCTWGAPGDPCEKDLSSPDALYRKRLARQFYLVKKSSDDRPIPNLVIFGFVGTFRGYYFPGLAPPAEQNAFTWFTLSGHTHNTGGTVTLKSADPRDTPEININYFEDGNDAAGTDLKAILNGVKIARKLAAGGAEGPAEGEIFPGPDVQTDAQLSDYIKNEAWGHHASCSNKMGPPSDPLAVVGSDFRVHGVKGLRVVDASVFPKIPGLFIVTPIYMIAEKASEIILKQTESATGSGGG